jgi:hypothetical protein
VLTGTASGRQTVVGDHGDCCDDPIWAGRHLLVFAGNGGYEEFVLDPATKTVHLAGGFSNAAVSPDGRWLLGSDFPPADEDGFTGVVSLTTGRCFAIPGGYINVGEQFDIGFTPDSSAVVDGTRRIPIWSLHQSCGSGFGREKHRGT